jgi:hypothetical protein
MKPPNKIRQLVTAGALKPVQKLLSKRSGSVALATLMRATKAQKPEGIDMAREVFVPYKPQRATLVVIDQANVIIDEYLLQSLKLTLRQLFYQFVARALIENTFRAYRRLRGIVAAARDGGLIDWNAMEDRTRSVHFQTTWSNPAARIRAAAHFYREDLWHGQLYRPEVWIEKSALLGVIEGICDHFRVPYFATIGNNSQLLQHEAGARFA